MKFERLKVHPRCRCPISIGLGLLALIACGLSGAAPPANSDLLPSQPSATTLAFRTMERLANGDAFDAKLRQRIWVGGREVVGVGHYEQSGGGTGRYSLEMTIHDGDSRQTMKQISDGRLAWNRSQIGTAVSVRRIDLGRIEESEQELLAARRSTRTGNATLPIHRFASAQALTDRPLPARLLAGGLIELLDRIHSDFDLRLGKGTVENQPVWILRGKLRPEELERIQKASGRDDIAPLCPVEVRVAIAANADANGFGAGLPIRFEFWSLPQAAPSTTSPANGQAEITDAETLSVESSNGESNIDAAAASASTADTAASPATVNEIPAGRLISLLEIYAMRRIEPSPEERFRFMSDDREVTFLNDTGRYLERLEQP